MKVDGGYLRLRLYLTILPSKVPEITLAVGSAVSPAGLGKAVAVGAAMAVDARRARVVSVYLMLDSWWRVNDGVLELLDVVMKMREVYILLLSLHF